MNYRSVNQCFGFNFFMLCVEGFGTDAILGVDKKRGNTQKNLP
jgi:hypothetical protein